MGSGRNQHVVEVRETIITLTHAAPSARGGGGGGGTKAGQPGGGRVFVQDTIRVTEAVVRPAPGEVLEGGKVCPLAGILASVGACFTRGQGGRDVTHRSSLKCFWIFSAFEAAILIGITLCARLQSVARVAL